MPKKVKTDEDVKRKAVKLVVSHLKRKISNDYLGKEHVEEWIDEIEELLKKEEFNLHEYHDIRRKFNNVIDSTLDVEMRYKLRDSWYSLGKALDKKVKRH